MLKTRPRSSCHGFVWVFAAIWLGLEAWLTLDATFHVLGLHLLLSHLGLTAHQIATLIAAKTATWPIASMVVFLLVREQAQRWMTGHVRCRAADRLATAWFTFLATLVLIDQLAPAITIVWSPGVVAATFWLLLTKAASLTSHFLHRFQRRGLWRKVGRIVPVHLLIQMGVALFSSLRNVKGNNTDGRSPHAAINRRAR